MICRKTYPLAHKSGTSRTLKRPFLPCSRMIVQLLRAMLRCSERQERADVVEKVCVATREVL